MKTELTVDGSRPALPVNLMDLEPESRLVLATKLATKLAEVVKRQHMYTAIGGRDYVHVDGWVLLGNLCGILPREVSITEDELGNVFATVELIRLSDGQVCGGASSMVGSDEPTWNGRPRYARRSMAVTRATGKAFRLSLSWVMGLAGFASTPFEEMPPAKPDPPGSSGSGIVTDMLATMSRAHAHGDENGIIECGKTLASLLDAKKITQLEYGVLRRECGDKLKDVRKGKKAKEQAASNAIPGS